MAVGYAALQPAIFAGSAGRSRPSLILHVIFMTALC